MTQPGYRHRILIIDRSGSIQSILAGQQSGLKEFFDSEASVPGRATYSLWEFDQEIACVHSMAAVDGVRDYQIIPRGMTAMNDAIGDAVEAEGAKLAALPEDQRPEDVTVIIASDGEENASARRSRAEVRSLLEHQQRVYGWRVLYMGTNQDAIAEAASSGVTMDMAVNYVATDTGAENSWASSASLLRRAPVAAAAAGGYAYTDEERELAGSAEKQPKAAPAAKAGPKRKLP